MPRFRKIAIAALAFTLMVILWGAFVRITGSGAGCGNHWPTCNGEVVPRSPAAGTVVELVHRVTSFGSLLFVVWTLIEAYRKLPRAHPARTSATAAAALMLSEILLGAGLVLFEMVAHNKSVARGYWVGAHLTNTFLLVGAMTATVWAAPKRISAIELESAAPGRTSIDHRRVGGLSGSRLWLVFGTALLGVLVVGVTGAIAALGDTLFPASSLAEGLALDVSRHAHVFLRLRALHPFAAATVAVYLLAVAASFARSGDPSVRRPAELLGAAVVLQVIVGMSNLLLLAPTALQLAHLFAADLVWMTLVTLTLSAAASEGQTRALVTPQPAHSR